MRVGDRTADHAAWSYPDPPADRSRLRDHVTFEWAEMDAWFEEDDEVYVHARDPYKRVDVLHSSRHVKVVVAGKEVVAMYIKRFLPLPWYTAFARRIHIN